MYGNNANESKNLTYRYGSENNFVIKIIMRNLKSILKIFIQFNMFKK